MKKQQYETLVDNIVGIGCLIVLFAMIFIAHFAVIVGAYAAIGLVLHGGESFTFYGVFYYVLLPLCGIMTTLSVALLYYSSQAKEYFEGANINYRSRDIWMVFSTKVVLELDVDWEKINIWLEENTNHVYMNLSHNGRRSYYFSSKADAMAFKLRWC